MVATKNLTQAPSTRNFSEAPVYSEIDIPRSGVVTLFGFGIKAIAERGHLLLEDGIGPERRRIRIPRVGHGLRRLVVIGSDGFVSLSALRWLADQDAAFTMLDRNGKVLAVTGPVRPSDARLRRAQACAAHSGADVVIAREIINRKLQGKNTSHTRNCATVLLRRGLQIASSISRRLKHSTLFALSSRAGRQNIGLRGATCRLSFRRRIYHAFPCIGALLALANRCCPDHNGSQQTRITRFSICFTALLKPSHVWPLAALGLDPGLGFIHADAPARDSLACDLMEAVRPNVDAYVLRLLREPLSRNYFFEERDGNCRLMADFASHLVQTGPTWASAVAPVAEWVAKTLWAGRHRAPSDAGIPTRLTQQRKREAKGRRSEPPEPRAPKIQKLCRDCGKPLKRGGKEHCAECATAHFTARIVDFARVGRIKAHSAEAGAKRGATQRRQLLAQGAWDRAEHPNQITKEQYLNNAFPRIKVLPNLRIARAIGVTISYAGMIRRGYLPHARHWAKLAQLAGVENV